LHIKCIADETLRKWWPPKGTLYTENIDGQPVCAVVKKNPDEAQGVLLLQLGNPSSALSKFEAAYDYNPHSIDISYWLGRAYYDLERWDDAIKFFTKDAAIKSKQAVYDGDAPILQGEALTYIGQAKMAQHKYDDAISAFRAVEYGYTSKRYATPPEVLANCGLCYYYQGAWASAIPYLEAVVAEYPNLSRALYECREKSY
jgi:tetratricopeptide (TPR) repeat protein